MSNPPIIIENASQQPFINIGVRFGGINFNGFGYWYHPIKDAFVRKDYLKKMRKYKDWQKFKDYVNKLPNNS